MSTWAESQSSKSPCRAPGSAEHLVLSTLSCGRQQPWAASALCRATATLVYVATPPAPTTQPCADAGLYQDGLSQVPPLQAEAHRSHEQAGAERASLSLPCPLTQLAMGVFACGTPVTCGSLTTKSILNHTSLLIFLNNIFFHLSYIPTSLPSVPTRSSIPIQKGTGSHGLTQSMTPVFLSASKPIARDNLSIRIRIIE